MNEANVVDIIREVMKRLHGGDTLKLINKEIKDKYDRFDINAAYSWLLTKYPDVDSTGFSSSTIPPPHRLLHFAERMVLGKEEYGFLLELVSNGIISVLEMEKIIERIMLGKTSSITITNLKMIVAGILLKKDVKPKSFRRPENNQDRLH